MSTSDFDSSRNSSSCKIQSVLLDTNSQTQSKAEKEKLKQEGVHPDNSLSGQDYNTHGIEIELPLPNFSKFQIYLSLLVSIMGYVVSYGFIRTWSVYITPIAIYLKNETHHASLITTGNHTHSAATEILKGDVHKSSSLFLFMLCLGMFFCGQFVPRIGNRLVCLISGLIGVISILLAFYSIKYGCLYLFYLAFINLGFIAGTSLCSSTNLIVKIYNVIEINTGKSNLSSALLIASLGTTGAFLTLPQICMRLINIIGVVNAILVLCSTHLILLIASYFLEKKPNFGLDQNLERPVLFNLEILKNNSDYVLSVIASSFLWMGFWGSMTWLPQWLGNIFKSHIESTEPNFIKSVLMILALSELTGRLTACKLVTKVQKKTTLFFLPMLTIITCWIILSFTDCMQTHTFLVKLIISAMGIANGMWVGIHMWMMSCLVKPEENVQALGMYCFFCAFTNWFIVQVYCYVLKFDYRLMNVLSIIFFSISFGLFYKIKFPKQ